MIFLEFELDIEPLSVNRLYGNIPGQARRFVSAEGKKFKSAVATAIRDRVMLLSLSKDISTMPGKPLTVYMAVGLPTWFLKDGKTIRKKDLDNTAKATLDSVFSTLSEFDENIDDSQIWELKQVKFVSETPKIKIIIQEYHTLQ
jgi:Holliday junction resolvase RusA-like endonuclease